MVSADHGSVAVGHAEHVHQHAAPRPPARWPHQVGVLPPRAQSFQHRSAAERLRLAVDSGGTAVLGQVLTGTGGVGKTQLAADYARSAWQRGEVDVLVWIGASTRSAVVARYAQAAEELLAVEPGDPERAAETFLAWLEPKAGDTPCRWLVVLDDADDPAELRGLWPPDSPHGRTLVTTRRREAALTGSRRRLVPVGLFTPAESAAYLGSALAAHDRHEPAHQLDALAADLGHLPLALAQAAAYLTDTALTAAGYRRLLADRLRRLADLLPEPGALPDDHAATVAATWSLSVERADLLRPAGLARPMLQLAAMLDPNGIPVAVLASEPALAHLTAHRSPGSRADLAPASAEDAAGALRALHRLSLVDHTPDDPVRVHRLIQRATRDTLTTSRHDTAALTAADALAAVWPDVERDTDLAQALRANTAALTAVAEDALSAPDAHVVLFHAGQSLGRSGQVAAARDHFRHLVARTADRLGPDHADTLGARHELAHWRGQAGDAAGAAAAFAELLADRLRLVGPDHLATFGARREHAYWLGSAGDAAGAVTAHRELLDDMLRVLGPDHPATLAARHNLAEWRGEAGDPAGAAAVTREVLADRLRVLGPDHPDTLASRSNLAQWTGGAGDAAGAAAAFTELLADRLRVLGPDHPATLTTRHNLAHWRGEAGDPPGAAAGYGELLDDMVRVLGPDHPSVLTTRANLAYWRGQAGDAAGAAEAFGAVLADRLRVLGPDHPSTFIARTNQARWRGEAGDPAGAEAAFAELLEDMLPALGADHPATLTARHNLAYWRGQAGDAPGAADGFARLLDDRLRVLGADHPETLGTRSNLAYWRARAGDPAGAVTLIRGVLADRLRVLGPDHPATLVTRSNLAQWQGQAGDAAGAAAACAVLLDDMLRVLGPDHAATRAVRHNLARWREQADGADPAR
ncbi:FxSxx-COOH system tetratricopeptide repeat protein [Kitasatospora sp. NPDC049285]|uniref:FxSxx-COOH system tetratricopeptide repeat protein n=1 Tax=Kitasatospora sp. NPDC049285 TaxID=3157096 RepID=UPI0034233801